MARDTRVASSGAALGSWHDNRHCRASAGKEMLVQGSRRAHQVAAADFGVVHSQAAVHSCSRQGKHLDSGAVSKMHA